MINVIIENKKLGKKWIRERNELFKPVSINLAVQRLGRFYSQA